MEDKDEQIRNMNIIIDACCLRMGVNKYDDLYNAVSELDEAVKKFIHEKDDGAAIRAWWDSREF